MIATEVDRMNDPVEVIDALDSDDAFAALSANQGRILYGMITNTATNNDIDAIFAE